RENDEPPMTADDVEIVGESYAVGLRRFVVPPQRLPPSPFCVSRTTAAGRSMNGRVSRNRIASSEAPSRLCARRGENSGTEGSEVERVLDVQPCDPGLLVAKDHLEKVERDEEPRRHVRGEGREDGATAEKERGNGFEGGMLVELDGEIEVVVRR